MKANLVFLICLSATLAINAATLSADSMPATRQRSVSYEKPKSAAYFQVPNDVSIKGAIWIIGSIEFGDTGFTFVPARRLPGWPPEYFAHRYPYNATFNSIELAYKDISKIKSTGKIRMHDGTKYYMVIFYRRYWRPAYKELNENVHRANEGGND